MGGVGGGMHATSIASRLMVRITAIARILADSTMIALRLPGSSINPVWAVVTSPRLALSR
jgi:hypothetical protein